MTAADIARGAPWTGMSHLNTALAGVRATIARFYSASRPTNVPRFPAAVADHPAFTRRFNARLVAVGMAATMNEHRRLIR